jgi:hypothetical protein
VHSLRVNLRMKLEDGKIVQNLEVKMEAAVTGSSNVRAEQSGVYPLRILHILAFGLHLA